jgi:hypothetical protein
VVWPFKRHSPASHSPDGAALAEIGESLQRLRALDGQLRVFGATTHRYASVRVSVREIEQFEDALGVGLPAEFRQFLLEIGYGAGPYYGIWSPPEILDEVTTPNEATTPDEDPDTHEGIQLGAGNPASWTLEDLRAMEARVAASPGNYWGARRPWTSREGIPICHEGCTLSAVLLTSGELMGMVWDVDEERFWLPAEPPPGIVDGQHRERAPLPSPASFVDWYSGWLQQCFTDLQSD